MRVGRREFTGRDLPPALAHLESKGFTFYGACWDGGWWWLVHKPTNQSIQVEGQEYLVALAKRKHGWRAGGEP